MEESQEILLNSLANAGVPIPPGVNSIPDLMPAAFVSICAQSLRLIDDSSSFPTELPDSVAGRFKACTELASAVKNLGYIGDLSFQKFLYPSEDDMHKLVRFLVGRLSESSEAGKSSEKKDNHASSKLIEEVSFQGTSKDRTTKIDNEEVQPHKEQVLTRLEHLKLKIEVSESSFLESIDVYRASRQCFAKQESASIENDRDSMEHLENSGDNASGNGEIVGNEINELQSQEKLLLGEVKAKVSELQHLEEEEKLLKAAVEMAFDDQCPVDSYIEQLKQKIDAKRQNLVELESQWEACRKPLEDKKRSLEEVLCATKPQAQIKLQKLKEIERETQSILTESSRREEELSQLSTDLEKRPKLPSRSSYIERIKEITKNSRKQDVDIELIVKETRELQLESNSIQERLHRTYAVVDETVFREAKKDPVGRKAHKLLTSIHESFAQMSEQILATDRARRELADHEAKLAAMACRKVNVDKLQADLDAIRKDNDLLQQRLHNI
ncbi:hypothetical protein RJ640_004888 [Escallonia rubra]|uniref:Coiled-coil domain-containing protein 22 homolog n=1 Tax=Escallonia rubra TaxID=112253 RepID=A0AA88R126_9ASTE|nr:hypothetical protein RJ640_004888 [Escallonia rubra]